MAATETSLLTQIERVPVDELVLYPGNPRRGDLDVIAESMAMNAQYEPLVVQASTRRVLAGNHRLLAAQQLGWSEVDVVVVDVDDEHARRIMLSSNRTSDLASYDEELLATQLGALAELEGTGFGANDLVELESRLEALRRLENPADPDEVPPVPVEAFSERGCIYELGEHRLMCGDATDADDLTALMGADLAALVVTSPPYNQQIDSFKPSGMQRENPAWVERMASAYADSLPEDEYQAQQAAMLDGLLAFTTERASVFYNHKHRYRDRAVVSPLGWIGKTQWQLRQEIIWDRASSVTLNARMFMPVDERIYWLTRGDFDFNDSVEVKSWGTVWSVAPRAEAGVTAPFPAELPRRCIAACSTVGAAVLDPYAGSGTVLIAAEEQGRCCFALELSEQYCDVIRQRYADYVGRPDLAPGAAT